MKLYYSFILALFIIFIFSSCLKEHNDIIPNLEGVPAGGLTGVKVKSVEGNETTLEVSLFVVDHFGGFISGLKAENFEIQARNSGVEFTFSLLGEIAAKARGPFSSTLLFDQSGSINTTDSKNARIDAGVSFASILDNGDEAAIAAFASGGFYTNPYELLQDFTTSSDQLVPVIEGLQGKADGGTPLYQSIYDLVTYTNDNGDNDNRAIIAFTDGDDTDQGVTIPQLVSYAQNKGVRVYTVGLGGGVDDEVLSTIAFETCGAVMFAEDAEQLVALYSSLGALLHGQALLYQFEIKVKRIAGDWLPNQVIAGNISLPLSTAYTINYPFTTTVLETATGRWFEKLPPCPCTYEEAQRLVESGCSSGEWNDCGSASEDFHYGATYEVRWYANEENKAGQQCTYDATKKLITGGIAAGSPDLVSPYSCGYGDFIGQIGIFVGCDSDKHCISDVKPWLRGQEETIPCWQYLRDWPANQGFECAPSNIKSGISHMSKMIGDMSCEEATILIQQAQEAPNLTIDSDLRSYIIGEDISLTDEKLISLLKNWKDRKSCNLWPNEDICLVLDQAIENLE